MVANVSGALAAYANAATRGVSPGMGARSDDGPSFATMLEQAAKGAVSTLKTGEQQTALAAVGKADINDVVMAVTNAEMTLQTVTTLRDKVVGAYQEILRMPI